MAKAVAIHQDDTGLNTWFERDRAHVELFDRDTEDTLFELWDEDVAAAVEDGFLDPRDYHGSMYQYALDLGAIAPADPRDDEEDDEEDE